jgi:hypothetical protein
MVSSRFALVGTIGERAECGIIHLACELGVIASPRNQEVTMSKTPLILIAAALIGLSAGPVLGDDGRELVGFAGPAVNGSGGIFEKHAMCDAAFPGSRMCSSKDILDNGGRDYPPAPGQAWIQPSLIFSDPNSGLFIDASGRHATDFLGKLSCLGWSISSSAYKGLTIEVQELGAFFLDETCNDAFLVACCAARKGRQ